MLSVKMILQSKVTINQVRTKKPCFRCFSRFVTRVLTLRPIDFLEHWYLQLLSHFLFLLESRKKVILFCTNFWVNKLVICYLNVLVCCCVASQYSNITYMFSKIWTQSAHSLIKPKLLLKMLLIEIIVESKVTRNWITPKMLMVKSWSAGTEYFCFSPLGWLLGDSPIRLFHKKKGTETTIAPFLSMY